MFIFNRNHSTLLRRFVLLTLLGAFALAAVPVLTTAQVLYGTRAKG